MYEEKRQKSTLATRLARKAHKLPGCLSKLTASNNQGKDILGFYQRLVDNMVSNQAKEVSRHW